MQDSKNIEQLIEQNGFYVSTTVGTSMWPMLRHRRDTVVIKKMNSRFKKYDVALYRMPNGKLLLHRVIKVLPEGYIGRGDNRIATENFCDSQVVGILDSFYRKGEKFSADFITYLPYILLSWVLFPLRWLINYGRRYFKNGYKNAISNIFNVLSKKP